MAGIGCLILGVCASCGHEGKGEERNEIQSNLEETEKLEYEIFGTGYGAAQELKEEESNGSTAVNESEAVESRTTVNEYWAGETSAVVYFDDHQKESQSQYEFAEEEPEEPKKEGNEVIQTPEEESLYEENLYEENLYEESLYEESGAVEEESNKQQPYYLSEGDREQVINALVHLGESYGLKYYPNITEGETWDSPTPIYAEELLMGRDHIMSAMVEYTEGAFALMQMEGCEGFALQIKEYPNTVTDAYYEVYVYWR